MHNIVAGKSLHLRWRDERAAASGNLRFVDMRMKIAVVPYACAVMAACQVDYHPYDTRVDGAMGINARNVARIEAATAGRREIRFAVISDTQRWYDETADAVEALNGRGDLDFVLHAGDMADFGMKAEFERMRDILDGLDVPYVAIIGNHDCLATGEDLFEEIFGDFDFAFTEGNVRVVCMNTNALEFDRDEPVPDFSFLEEQILEFPANAEKSVVAMHSRPFTEQFDNNVARVFEYAVSRMPGLQFCVNGHSHTYDVAEPFGDGVLYYGCENIAKRSYLLITIDDNGYDCEKVDF